jgi:hypothetical protein
VLTQTTLDRFDRIVAEKVLVADSARPFPPIVTRVNAGYLERWRTAFAPTFEDVVPGPAALVQVDDLRASLMVPVSVAVEEGAVAVLSQYAVNVATPVPVLSSAGLFRSLDD